MATKNFPGPNINRIIENDPQIISQGNKQHYEWGARASGMPKDTKNGMTIKHVGNEK